MSRLYAVLVASVLGFSSVAAADRGVSSTDQLRAEDKGAGIIGLKIGALLPQAFSPLGANWMLQLEGGYLLPFYHRLIGIVGSISVATPTVSGSAVGDLRVSSGSFDYEQQSQQFLLGLTLMGHIPLGRVVPYVGVGPRAFVVRTVSTGQAGGSAFPGNSELSVEPGVGVPVGLGILLGPGRLCAEFQLLYAPAQQRSTGSGSFGSMSLSAGYLFVL